MEDFVPYELAIKLVEKGFNYETRDIYERNTLACRYEDVPKPTISQVLKWLREKRIHLYTDIDNEGWFFEIKYLKTQVMINTDFFKRHNTYELATFAGIEYCIDNLI